MPFPESKWQSVPRETILFPAGPILSLNQRSGFRTALWENSALVKARQNRAVGCPIGVFYRPVVSVVAARKSDLFRRQGEDSRKAHLSFSCPETAHRNCSSQGGLGPWFGCRFTRNPPCDYSSNNPLSPDRKQAAKGLVSARGHSANFLKKHICPS